MTDRVEVEVERWLGIFDDKAFFSGRVASGRGVWFWVAPERAAPLEAHLHQGPFSLGVPPWAFSDRAPGGAWEDPFSADTPQAEGMKSCPFCAEQIRFDAIRCKHCQADLRTGVETRTRERDSSADQLGPALLVVPLIGTVLVIFWVGQMSLIQGPGSALALVAIATVVATAILIFLEARRVGAGDGRITRGAAASSPIAWCVAAILIWIIVYPMWMYQRSKFGLRNRVALGLLVALVFSGVTFSMGAAIESKRAEIINEFDEIERELDDLGNEFG